MNPCQPARSNSLENSATIGAGRNAAAPMIQGPWRRRHVAATSATMTTTNTSAKRSSGASDGISLARRRVVGSSRRALHQHPLDLLQPEIRAVQNDTDAGAEQRHHRERRGEDGA